MSTAPEVSRSPADVLRLGVAVVAVVALLLIEWVFGDTLVGFASDLLRGLEALPTWLVELGVALTRFATIVVLVGGLIWTAVRAGGRMALTVLVAVAVAAALVALFGEAVEVDEGATSVALRDRLGPLSDRGFPTAYGIAALAAALTAAAPWLSRGWRRCGWLAVLGLVLTRFATAPVAFDSFRSALLGWAAGAAVLVAMGAPSRRATPEAVIDGLAAVGLPLASLKAAGVDARGSTPYFGAAADGSRFFVKALGQDQRSADLMFRAYRYIQRKDLGDERPFSSLRRAVEHEAFVSLMARDLGARTPRVRPFAVAEPNTLVLAYDAVAGRSLDRLEPEEITDELLGEIWAGIAHLREHRIAHRDLRLANVFVGDDGGIWMIDFGFSEVAASDLLLANDVAELVASSAVVVGVERATAPARASVDAATLERARERLRPWALSGATRTALKEQPGLLDAISAGLAAN